MKNLKNPEDIWARYEADKALVMADPELSEAEKGQAITELTAALIEQKAALGIKWKPLFKIKVEQATGDGSVEIELSPQPKGDA